MKKIKCITIYPEVYSSKETTFNEKIYLSVIRYYTVEGRTHCCKFSDKEMADELEMSVGQIWKIKSRLKKMGLITVTDDGIYYNSTLPNSKETLPNSKETLPNSKETLPNSKVNLTK